MWGCLARIAPGPVRRNGPPSRPAEQLAGLNEVLQCMADVQQGKAPPLYVWQKTKREPGVRVSCTDV